MKSLEVAALLFLVSLVLVAGVFLGLAGARPSEPLTNDYAEFAYDPYPIGPNTITVRFVHESSCYMTIWLYYYDSEVWHWTVDRYMRSGAFSYSASADGVWRLECYMSGYAPYWTDEARDSFCIADPVPSQSNLGQDWARNPQDWNIYSKALQIISGTTDSYVAAQRIYAHVSAVFNHTGPDYSFRKDLDLLSDLNTYGQYRGVCRSDAVILTSYARSLGIPARIVHLTFYDYTGMLPGDPFDPHYHAEFYVWNGTAYDWVPVDGDYEYFGIAQANQVISLCWPRSKSSSPYPPYFYLTSTTIVTYIPYGGLVDSGFTEISYPSPVPYRNNLPYRR